MHQAEAVVRLRPQCSNVANALHRQNSGIYDGKHSRKKYAPRAISIPFLCALQCRILSSQSLFLYLKQFTNDKLLRLSSVTNGTPLNRNYFPLSGKSVISSLASSMRTSLIRVPEGRFLI